MNTEHSLGVVVAVSDVHARAELCRLLDDSRFHGTDRTRSILKYLAERRFEGQADSVKAYSIALDVLGRRCDFDPTTDPIVRIEMSRLRSALSQYYEAFGSESAVVITLPKGHYVAEFTYANTAPAEAHEDEATDAPRAVATAIDGHSSPAPVKEKPRDIRKHWRPAACLALAASVIIAAGTWYGMQPDITEKPTVAVTMTAPDEALAGEASLTRDMLLTALTQFSTLTVTNTAPATGSFATSLRPRRSNAYTIDLKYYGDTDDRSVWWQIVDARTGDLLKSGLERVSADGKAAVAVRDELVSVLSRRFAPTRGVINNIERHDAAENVVGNACVLRAEYDLDDGGANDLTEAAGCLERTVAKHAWDSDAAAALSRVIIAQAGGHPSKEAMERSLDLANLAVSLAPLSDRAQIAQMMAQFYSGRTPSAIETGKKAMALNPNNPDVTAKLGMVLFSSGYWDAGVSLAQDAGRSVDVVPRDATMVLALDAYRRADWSSASLLAEQLNGGDAVVRLLRAASLGEIGSEQATQRLADIRLHDPDFEQTYSELMSARRFVPALAQSIKAGLVKAGANMETQRSARAF
ncbi:MAG: tetratricopeptide repeat protein [Shinella sp.]